MNRVSRNALAYAVPRQVHVSLEECCYPTCESPSSDKIQEPFCDRHMIKIFRLVTDLGKQFDQHPALPGKVVNSPSLFKVDKPYIRTFKDNPTGLVYFILFGNRIKIGFSTKIIKRLGALPHEEVLALVPGTLQTERMFHSEFSQFRVQGEWFVPHPALFERIEELKAQYEEYRIS